MAALPFLFPLLVIVVFLFVLRYLPERAALYGAAAAFVVGLFSPQARRRFLHVHELLMDISRSFLILIATGGLAGIIVSALVLSGIGPSFVSSISSLAGRSLILTLLLAALVNLILGLGLPAIITYILLAVLVAPTIVQLGEPPMAAHLFTLYFAVAAELTPPAGAPIFITMAIAQASFLRTALEGLKLAAGVFLLPFVFVYHPGLLLLALPAHVVIDFAVALVGMAALSFGIRGIVVHPVGILARALLILGGGGLLVPYTPIMAAGAVLLALAGGFLWRQRLSATPPALDKNV